MKLSRIIILIIITVTSIQANPRRHHHPRPYYDNYYYGSIYATRYSPYYSPYRSYLRYSPIVVTTKTITTYPENLVTVTVESIAPDIVDLNTLMSRGLISEKEFERAKKTLLNRIGMSINPKAGEATPSELIEQIETLYQMHSRQLLTEKEYQKQKRKLLALI